MGVTIKIYGVSFSFCCKLAIYGKTVTPIDFERKFEIFENTSKLIYETIMYNRFRIWGSRSINTEFQSVFAANWRFTVKP
jgi:hypothetical protein